MTKREEITLPKVDWQDLMLKPKRLEELEKVKWTKKDARELRERLRKEQEDSLQ